MFSHVAISIQFNTQPDDTGDATIATLRTDNPDSVFEVEAGQPTISLTINCGIPTVRHAPVELSDRRKRAVLLLTDPQNANRSNRWFAQESGLSHPTIATMREALELSGEIERAPEKRLGRDGKERKSRRK